MVKLSVSYSRVLNLENGNDWLPQNLGNEIAIKEAKDMFKFLTQNYNFVKPDVRYNTDL
jgi:hypothetical protein